MSEPNIHVIESEPAGVDVIARLEEALEQARKGQISSIAIAVVYRDGCTQPAWSQAPSYSLLIGAVSRLLFALHRKAEE